MTINGNGHLPQELRVPWSGGGHQPVNLIKMATLEALKQHWPWVRDRLWMIKKKDKSCDSWHPTHIKNQIVEGLFGRSTVELYFGVNKEGVIEGFIITTVRGDPYIQLPVALLVWLAWANQDLIEKLLPALEAIARERELFAIEFISGRKGWIRPSRIIKHGFQPYKVSYRKELG